MASPVNRRRFLKTAGAGIAAGVAVHAGKKNASAAEPPAGAPLIPVPDSKTKRAGAPSSAPSASCGPTTCCIPAAKLIFTCSGAADVGKISDLAARKLNEDGVGKMFCLAGVGGRVKGIMETTKAAQAILVIDGCPLECARNTLVQAGVTKFEHVRLADLGMEKGKTPPTEAAVKRVVSRAKARFVG